MGDYDCPTCDASFDTKRGRGVHHVHVHDERLPNRTCDNCESSFCSDYAKRYCSRECLIGSDAYAGENNPNYKEERRRLNAKYAEALSSSILLRSQVCFVITASKRSSGRLRQGSVDQTTPDGVAGKSKPPANCADLRFGEIGAPSRKGALRYAAANVIVCGSPRSSPARGIRTGKVADPSFTDRAGAEPS